MLQDFQNIFLFARIGHLKKIIFKGRGFWCGSDEKMRSMWLGLGIVVVGLPSLASVKCNPCSWTLYNFMLSFTNCNIEIKDDW